MATILVSDILARVRSTLLDAAAQGWTNTELISYLNGGMTQIVALKPDANPVSLNMALDPGVEQVLPDDGVLFLDCLRNHAGDSVTVEAAHEFVRTHTTWPTDAPGATRYVLFDPRFPRTFHVYPPADSGRRLPIFYGALAPRVDATTDEIGLPNTFETALWAFVVGSAYAKNSKRQDLTKADQFMKLFAQSVALNTPAERATAARADPKGAA